jgi:hypothetical protein
VKDVLWWLGVFSAASVVAAILFGPLLAARIPVDYFAGAVRPHPVRRHPVLHWTLRVVKTALGVVCIPAGIAMIALPGPGILTILLGVMLLEFPGKFRLERAIVRKPFVLKALNALRRRAGAPPLIPPGPDGPA